MKENHLKNYFKEIYFRGNFSRVFFSAKVSFVIFKEDFFSAKFENIAWNYYN